CSRAIRPNRALSGRGAGRSRNAGTHGWLHAVCGSWKDPAGLPVTFVRRRTAWPVWCRSWCRRGWSTGLLVVTRTSLLSDALTAPTDVCDAHAETPPVTGIYAGADGQAETTAVSTDPR